MSDACVTTVVDGTFQSEVLDHSGTVLVDVYTPQCPPCRAIAPVVEDLCAQRKPALKIVKMDAYENRTTAAKLQISVVPTFILYCSGQVLGRTQGAPSRTELERWIDSLLQNVA
jgi:thioredoxin 1